MISVIIPVYNTKQYLRSCLDSILSQTYSDLELLFIDDGSTDGSAELLDSFKERDDRIRVIHQENAGVSAARNRGLSEARGDYITFVDSDDTLEPDMYETLLGLVQEYGVDIAHCSYNRVEENRIKPVGNTGNRFLQNREEALECFLAGKLYSASCWNKLYARRLFEGVRFRQDIKMSEDLLVNIAVFNQVSRSVFWDICKYNYLSSETSACRNTPSIRKAADHIAVARELCTQFEKKCQFPLAQKRLLNALLSAYKAQIYAPNPDNVLLKKLSDEIHNLRESGVLLSNKQQLDYDLMRHVPGIYKPIYRLYDRIRVPNLDV